MSSNATATHIFSAKNVNVFVIFQDRNFSITLANNFFQIWTAGPRIADDDSKYWELEMEMPLKGHNHGPVPTQRWKEEFQDLCCYNTTSTSSKNKRTKRRHCLGKVPLERDEPEMFGQAVEVLRPSQPSGVMSSLVSLPNHTFTGQA